MAGSSDSAWSLPPEEGDGPPQEESPTEHQPEHQPARQSERNYLSRGSRLIVVALLVATGLLLIMSRSCGETPAPALPALPVVETPAPALPAPPADSFGENAESEDDDEEVPSYESLAVEVKECVDRLRDIRKPVGGISDSRAIRACVAAVSR